MKKLVMQTIIIIGLLTIAITAYADPDTPISGRSDGDAATTIETPANIVMMGVQSYYMVYGEWPFTWQEVLDSKLAQVEFKNINGDIFNPDSMNITELWEAKYIPPSNNAEPKIAVMVRNDGMQQIIYSIPTPMTLEEQLTEYEEMCPDLASEFEAILADINRLKLYAISSMLTDAIMFYNSEYHHVPATFAELLDSGYAPINGQSINPVTNDVFHGDGRPNDFQYIADLENNMTLLSPTDENGEVPFRLFP